MDAIGTIVAANSALALVGAVLAWAVGRWSKRPALAHALWLLALLKLVTPPLWTVDPWPSTRSTADALERSSVDHHGHEPLERNGSTEGMTAAFAGSESLDRTFVEAPSPSEPLENAAAASTAETRAIWRRWGPAVALWVWVCGSAIVAAVAAVRMMRFHRLLRHATLEPPAVQTRARRLARRLGARGTCPTVWRVPGPLCPLLWAGFGPPRVLAPGRLWDGLDSAQRDALLLHELAHWRRRDHWVRWLELLVAIVHWWNPICWWARRGLREAEEMCCDAWVMWARPEGYRPYARALLDALEFAAAGPGGATLRPRVPALASGMGQFGHLSRRLVMLKRTDLSRRLSGGSLVAVCGVGAMLLPLSAGRAQPAVERAVNTTSVDVEAGAPTTEAPLREARVATASRGPLAVRSELDAVVAEALSRSEGGGDESPELTEARNELAAATAQFQQQYKKLMDVRQRLEQLEREAGYRVQPDDLSLSRQSVPARVAPRAANRAGARVEVERGDRLSVPARGQTPVAEIRREPSRTETRTLTTRTEETSAPAGSQDTEARLQAVEDKLRALLDEVRSVRDESKAETQGEAKTVPGR